MVAFSLHTFGADKIAMTHAASGYTALSDRTMVETARAAELPEVSVSLLARQDSRFNPPLQPLAEPSPEVIRWAARITDALDSYLRMSSMDQYFCDLQALLAATEVPPC